MIAELPHEGELCHVPQDAGLVLQVGKGRDKDTGLNITGWTRPKSDHFWLIAYVCGLT